MDVKTAIRESGKQLGYDELRPKQIEAMTSFLQGNDVFVSTNWVREVHYLCLIISFLNSNQVIFHQNLHCERFDHSAVVFFRAHQVKTGNTL